MLKNYRSPLKLLPLYFYLVSCSELSKSSSKTKQNQSATSDKDQSAENSPKLTKPRVKKIWIEDQIQGERYIEGHWEYVIEENSTWGGK